MTLRMPAAQYRKRPVLVNAIRWTGDDESVREVQKFLGPMENMDGDVRGERFYRATLQYDELEDDDEERRVWPDDYETGGRLWVEANQIWMPIEPGEWILQDWRGAYPCKPDIFAVTYEPLAESTTP